MGTKGDAMTPVAPRTGHRITVTTHNTNRDLTAIACLKTPDHSGLLYAFGLSTAVPVLTNLEPPPGPRLVS